MRIPFNKPYMTGKELWYIAQAHANGHLAGDGEFTKKCNDWLQTHTSARRALLTQSCTAAAQLLNRHGAIENFPPHVLGERRDLALLFKDLATLRTDAPLFRSVDELEWRGPTDEFAAWTERMEAPRLLDRGLKAKSASDPGRG